MELTKKMLEEARFRARGKWYDGQQVDAFLERLTVAVDEAEREKEERSRESRQLKAQLDEVLRENGRLEQELKALRDAPSPAMEASESQLKICRELERQRDSLIQDIKALRRFREEFRASVARDAASLSEQVGELGSDKLLRGR